MTRLLVGLGNPGPEYEDTRHNAGFWWIDTVARLWGVHLQPERGWFGLAARCQRQGETVWLLQPQTYMNLSGRSVAALARFYKIEPRDVLVVHDELDLPPGELKLKQGGSPAGHNGLKDIHAQLGTPDYWRLRLGIGHPGVRAEVVNYVLRKPPADERRAIDDAIVRSLAALDLIVAGDMARATALLHARPQRPKPPRKEMPPKAAAPTEIGTVPAAPPADASEGQGGS